MKRNIAALTNKPFDLLIVGAGICGACAAWDAALRGLSVAIIDRCDFGQETSANSLKTIHGGLRYLQDFDLGLVRTMISERTTFMRIAPHLVHPLPCVVPTQGRRLRSRHVMAAALAAYNMLCAPYNRLLDPEKRLPNSRILSKEACLKLMPGISCDNITGGALWYDAQVYNSERLTLAFIRSAAEYDAEVANYVEALDLIRSQSRVRGVRARDTLTGTEFDIQAKLVINTCGPWGNRLLRKQDGFASEDVRLSVALNLVTRQLIPDVAVGIPSRSPIDRTNGESTSSKKAQILFIAPWRQYSLIGTKHIPYDGSPDEYQIQEADIARFLEQVNNAYPSARLRRNDVHRVHYGFLPADQIASSGDYVKLLRRSIIVDHARDGFDGLLSVIGVKYTSARHAAQEVLDIATVKLGTKNSACRTHKVPVHGGHIENFESFLKEATVHLTDTYDKSVVNQLAYSYGTAYGEVLNYVDSCSEREEPLAKGSSIIQAQVAHAVHKEMAQKLSDVVFRRTELGAAGECEASALLRCARLMASESGWDNAKTERELKDVEVDLSITKSPIL